MSTGFPGAAQSRVNSRNNGVIHGEISTIQSAVLEATQAGKFSVTVDQSIFTTSPAYYHAWRGTSDDPTLIDQIQQVRSYFINKGYGVDIMENALSTNTWYWRIQW